MNGLRERESGRAGKRESGKAGRRAAPFPAFQLSSVLGALVLLAGLLAASVARGQGKELQQANRIDCSLVAKTNWVAFSNQYSLVYTVEIDNFTANDIYLFLADWGTNAVNGATGTVTSVKVPSGTTGGKNWGPTGAPFNSLNVAASTTPYTLTNLSANVGVITVTRRRNP